MEHTAFYRRYVNIFYLFHTEFDANLLFNYINSQHLNINFTMEKESDHCLSFLDIYIDIGHLLVC